LAGLLTFSSGILGHPVCDCVCVIGVLRILRGAHRSGSRIFEKGAKPGSLRDGGSPVGPSPVGGMVYRVLQYLKQNVEIGADNFYRFPAESSGFNE